MATTSRNLSEEDIHRVYEMLGMASEEERLRIVERLYFSQEHKPPVRIEGDTVTTPYPDNNA
jgi:hypothetical protein